MASSYTGSAFVRALVIATVVAGTLDILSAFAFAANAGGNPLGVLSGIAGAVIDPELIGNPITLAGLGLAIHFAIMTVMVAVYLTIASRAWLLNRLPLISGISYGVILWGVMYWIILPHRFPTMFPLLARDDVAMQLFQHIVLVGIPIALIARRATRWRADYW